jgi:hypothetical protein
MAMPARPARTTTVSRRYVMVPIIAMSIASTVTGLPSLDPPAMFTVE